MADFRQIKCAMWREDDWFLDLPTDAKLFWIYLFSNPSASVAGIYRLSLRTMANETGLDQQRIAELLTMFADDNKAHFADGVIWVVKMREHQATSSDKVKTKINSDIATLPKDNHAYRMYARRYGIDTVSIPIHTDTDTDTYTDTIQRGDDTPAAPPIDTVSSGKKYAQKIAGLNGQVPVATRLPIVEKLLDVYGLRAMVEAGDDNAHYAMHEQAVKLYRMGYHTGEAVESLAALWKEKDWRGKKGERPRNGQFLEFASQNTANVKPKKTPQKMMVIDPATGASYEVTA